MHGRLVCRPQKPLCRECVIQEFCPYPSSVRQHASS
jgi:endonuclease III